MRLYANANDYIGLEYLPWWSFLRPAEDSNFSSAIGPRVLVTPPEGGTR